MVRDGLGRVLLAFSYFFGAGSNNLAEAKAALIGLPLCQQFHISIFFLECDSLLLVLALKNLVKRIN